jgi:glycerol-3-phosphate dehydrogenase (NAD(P)+)
MGIERIGVLGGGAWGTALAQACAYAGRNVTLWEHDPVNAAHLTDQRESKFLPGVELHRRIVVTRDLATAARVHALLLVVPAQVVRTVLKNLAPVMAPRTPIIACAKGIEHGTNKFMTEIITECTPTAVPAILSGPSFAIDVARGLPTAVTLACRDPNLATALAHAIGSPTFRPYHSSDTRGVEIGGAAKNVLAIASGIVAGRGLGASAAAALITRGFAEMVRFGKAYGAKAETLTGLSGLGDLVLTCSSAQSRNYSFGVDLAKGKSPKEAGGGKLAEGAFTAPVLVKMALAKTVDMPIATAIAAIVAGQMNIDKAIESLLARPVGEE